MPPSSTGSPIVTVCRGCCCGTPRKHPDVDHDAQLVDLTASIGEAGRVRVSDCLDACKRSNVVVVGASATGRRAGGRPVWLAGVLDPGLVAAVAAWVRSGGPGIAEPPADLHGAVFRSPGTVRNPDVDHRAR